MANEVPAQYEGQVVAELQALIDSVRGDIEAAAREVHESQNEINAPLKTFSRLRMSDIVGAGILIAKLGVRPRCMTSVRASLEVLRSILVDRGTIEKQAEVADDQVRLPVETIAIRSVSDLLAGRDMLKNHGESVDAPERLLVDALGLPVSLAAQVWEVCRAFIEMNRRHTHGRHGFVDLAKQIIVASVTMPQVFKTAFQSFRLFDFGSSIDRRALAVTFDDYLSSGGMRTVAALFMEPESSLEVFAKIIGYDTIEDYRCAKILEHNQQLEVLELDKDLKEIIEIDPDENHALEPRYKHLLEVLQRDANQFIVEQSGDLMGHEGGGITAAGMFSVSMSERQGTRAYITPKRVAYLMLELAKPAPGERIYDPCFGFGELLAGVSRRRNNGPNVGDTYTSLGAQGPGIFGVERDLLPYAVGLCRLMLADVDYSGLRYDDALNPGDPLPHTGADSGFDCIVAAPPWGRGGLRSAQFPLPSRSTENQFLQHVMGSLRPGGRAVVALPEATLFRTEDRHVRKALLLDYRVDGVVSLPAGAFEPCTSLPMSLLMFSRFAPRETVRFARVSPEAWDATAMDDAGDAVPKDSRGLPDEGVFGAEMFREISALFGHREEKRADAGAQGVEAWDVPLRELESRDYELIAKKSGNEVLESELARLVAAEPSLGIERLEHVAEVRGGLSYKLRLRNKRGDRPDVIAGLIYPGDVTDHGIRPPKWFLSPEGIALVKESTFLRGGDLVVTTAGTGGNIGFVEDGMVTMLAATGVARIRARNGIDPRFLAALLRSPVYRNWLSGHARGPTRHLSLRILRTLKFPVPPLPIQAAMVEEIRGPRADALAVLFRLMSGTDKSPVMTWLETPVAARLAAGSTVGRTDGIDALVEVAQGIQSLTVSESSDRSIRAWLEGARKAAAALDGITSIPRSSGRLAVLQFGVARLLDALGTLDEAEGSVGGRLRSLTRAMVELVEREVHAMQHSVAVDIGVDTPELIAGITNEVRLQVTNRSDVPLRSVAVAVRPTDGPPTPPQVVGYLPEGETRYIPVEVRPRDSTQPLSIAVTWTARRLDGTPVQGAKEVPLLVSSSKDAADPGDLGKSPYIVGSPVDRDEMFFGRAGTMAQIRRQLGGGDHANVILLEGNRRTGKTSILRQLGKADALPGWFPIYCSFQDVDSVATSNVFRLLARQTGWTLADAGIETWIPDLPRPDPAKPFKLAFGAALHRAFSDEHPFETLEVYLATVIEAAKPRRILLMLDEFDKLQEGIDGGITSPQVPENIRHLLQHQPGLGAIITGSRRLKRLREEYWSALFGFGYRIGVSALPKADARCLVTEPVAGRLRYLPQAVEQLVALCACHPFLIQSLCSRVFDQASTGSDRTITLDIVERAATEMVRDNEHFQTLWGYAGSERRRLILALCDRLAEGSDAVNIYLLRLEFDRYGVPIRRDSDLADDIAELRELELMDLDPSYRNGTYRLSIPLMAKWLKRNVDFGDLVVRAKQETEDAL